MDSCKTQNAYKMPPDQLKAMKSPTPQTQPGFYIPSGHNYPCLKPPWLHVYLVRQAWIVLILLTCGEDVRENV